MGDLLPFFKPQPLYSKTKTSATKRHKKHKRVKKYLRAFCASLWLKLKCDYVEILTVGGLSGVPDRRNPFYSGVRK